MRILHTSDWHVGKTLRGRSRAEEHEAVLREITEIAEAEQVDLVVVAGDCFETAAPAPESEAIVYRALLELARTASVLVVAGNHDNERRLAAIEPLLGLGNVIARPLLLPPDQGGLVTVETRAGAATVAMVPFVSQRYVVKAEDLMQLDPDEHAQKYNDRVRRLLEKMCEGFRDDTVNLVVAHLMVAGGVMGGGERSAHTVFDYFVDPTAFPASAHYVALGHLHRTQKLPGPCPIHYSGSPLQLDFGETTDEKSVLIVDAAPNTPAGVRAVPLRSGRRLRKIAGTLDELEALRGTTGDDYLRVHVREQARAGLADAVREMFPEAVDVVVESPRSRDDETGERQSRAGRSPHDLFVEYLTEKQALDERVVALFDRLLDEVHTAHAADPA